MITGSAVWALEGFPFWDRPSETWTSLISSCALQGGWRRTTKHPTSPGDASKPESGGGGVLGKSNEQWRKEATAHSAPEGAGYLRDTGLCRGRLDGATGPEDGAPFERFCPFPAGTAPVRAARPLGGSVPVPRRAFFPPAAAGRSSPPPAGSPRQARWPVWRPSWGEGAGRGLPARSPPSPALPRDALGQTGSENCWVRPV